MLRRLGRSAGLTERRARAGTPCRRLQSIWMCSGARCGAGGEWALPPGGPGEMRPAGPLPQAIGRCCAVPAAHAALLVRCRDPTQPSARLPHLERPPGAPAQAPGPAQMVLNAMVKLPGSLARLPLLGGGGGERRRGGTTAAQRLAAGLPTLRRPPSQWRSLLVHAVDLQQEIDSLQPPEGLTGRWKKCKKSSDPVRAACAAATWLIRGARMLPELRQRSLLRCARPASAAAALRPPSIGDRCPAVQSSQPASASHWAATRCAASPTPGACPTPPPLTSPA